MRRQCRRVPRVPVGTDATLHSPRRDGTPESGEFPPTVAALEIYMVFVRFELPPGFCIPSGNFRCRNAAALIATSEQSRGDAPDLSGS